MEQSSEDANGGHTKPFSPRSPEKTEDHVNGEDYSESKSLLSPRIKEGRKVEKTRRKVQWNDKNGNKLAEVLVFEPSEASDSENDEDSDSCTCTIL